MYGVKWFYVYVLLWKFPAICRRPISLNLMQFFSFSFRIWIFILYFIFIFVGRKIKMYLADFLWSCLKPWGVILYMETKEAIHWSMWIGLVRCMGCIIKNLIRARMNHHSYLIALLKMDRVILDVHANIGTIMVLLSIFISGILFFVML
jgi:hypothetical protein